MKAFSFFIPAEDFTYSFVLPSKTMNGAEFVNTAGLRHPDFLTKTNAARIGLTVSDAIVGEECWQEYKTFANDLQSIVNKIVAMNMEVTYECLQDAFLHICDDHINRFGRLFYHDLLSYADLATYVSMAIYDAPTDAYHSFYKNAVYNVMNTFPTKVLHDFFGEYISYADNPVFE